MLCVSFCNYYTTQIRGKEIAQFTQRRCANAEISFFLILIVNIYWKPDIHKE